MAKAPKHPTHPHRKFPAVDISTCAICGEGSRPGDFLESWLDDPSTHRSCRRKGYVILGRTIDGEPSWYEEQLIAALSGLELDRFRVVVDTALSQKELATYLDEMGHEGSGGGAATDEQI